MSRRHVARAALLVALAAIWSVAAYLLWQSRVPSSLHLPHVAVDRYFAASSCTRLRHTAGSARAWGRDGGGRALVLALYARWGVRFARESGLAAIGTGMMLGMIGFALLWLAELPFDVAALWWQRRRRLTHTGYISHIFGTGSRSAPSSSSSVSHSRSSWG